MLLVVRDPRAVAASTIGPNAAAWTGEPRPSCTRSGFGESRSPTHCTPGGAAFARLEA